MKKTFELTNEAINDSVEEIRKFAESKKAEHREVQSLCLTLEEVLVNLQSHFGCDYPVRLKTKKSSGSLFLYLDVSGKSFNPLENGEEGTETFIINALNMAPTYSYANGNNRIAFRLSVNQGAKELKTIFAALLIGVAIGLCGKLLPDGIMQSCQTVISAISDAIFGLMSMSALPVIFLCVVYGILGCGTIASFKENGLRILRKYLLSMVLLLTVGTAVSIVFFGLKVSFGVSGSTSVNTMVDTLFSIIPDNIFAPFMNGDNVKVIMLGVIFGCATLALGDRVNMVGQLCGQLKEICSLVMMGIGKMIPVLVVVVLVDNIWNGSIGPDMFMLWKIVLVYVVTIIITLCAGIALAARATKHSFAATLKSLIMPGIKGFVSASSMFCFSDMTETLQKDLGVSKSTVSFGLPLGMAFYQPIIVLYGVFVLYFAGVGGIQIDLTWLLSYFLICFVISIAAPPVSGGSLSLLAILFAYFGISEGANAVAFPLFLLLDYPNTAFRVMMLIVKVAQSTDGKQKKMKKYKKKRTQPRWYGC